MSSTTLATPAKINLTLEILGKRPDGFHELKSIVLPVSLCDTITVMPRSDSVVTCETVGDGTDVAELYTLPLEKQLAVKALRVMQNVCGVETGADIRIVKRIPIGAGMGGGSADAVGTIRALAKLWNFQFSIFNFQLFAAIGSDVPALIHGTPVLMEGRGERTTPLPAYDPPLHFVIAFPGIAVSTKSVYEEYDRLSSLSSSNQTTGWKACRTFHNDLEDTVFRLYPEVRQLRDLLLSCGARQAMVSGSGSAVFGVADDENHAREIQSRLPSSLWTRTVKSV